MLVPKDGWRSDWQTGKEILIFDSFSEEKKIRGNDKAIHNNAVSLSQPISSCNDFEIELLCNQAQFTLCYTENMLRLGVCWYIDTQNIFL